MKKKEIVSSFYSILLDSIVVVWFKVQQFSEKYVIFWKKQLQFFLFDERMSY